MRISKIERANLKSSKSPEFELATHHYCCRIDLLDFQIARQKSWFGLILALQFDKGVPKCPFILVITESLSFGGIENLNL